MLGLKDIKVEKNPQYNSEPVYYCKNCLSLKVRGVGDSDEFNYCDDCGNTIILQCDIKEWEEMFEKKYGYKFLDK